MEVGPFTEIVYYYNQSSLLTKLTRKSAKFDEDHGMIFHSLVLQGREMA